MRKLRTEIGRFVRRIPNWLYRTFIGNPAGFFKKRGARFVARIREWKKHPQAFLCGLRSFFIPGWGQLKNRQWYKAIPCFALFLFVVGLELATSGYFRAAADMERYPIVTQDMIEGGTFYQETRTAGTIVNGLMLTAEDVATGGAYDGFRLAGAYVVEGGLYLLLDDADVAEGGAYFASAHVAGDVVAAGADTPTMLTPADVADGGAFADSPVAVGDVVLVTITAADVAAGGDYFETPLAVGQLVRYVVADADLWPEGDYFGIDRQIGDFVRDVVTAADLLEGGRYYNSGKAVGDVVYVRLDALTIAAYAGSLGVGDITNGVALAVDSADTYYQVGDVVWVVADDAYKQLTAANVNTAGAAYYHVYRTAGTIVSADGVNPPKLMTGRLVAAEGMFYGQVGVSVGTVKYLPVNAWDLLADGRFYGMNIAAGDRMYVAIDPYDVEPNRIDLLIDQGYYRAILGVEADNIADRIYFFRDYGGWFTKGFWGLVSLGEVPTMTTASYAAWYRGWPVIVARSANQADYPSWVEADNSRSLLTNGVIVLVVSLICAAVWIMNVRDAYRSHVTFEQTGFREAPKKFIRRVWDENFGYIIVLPTFILIAFFTLIPFLFSFLTGFTSWDSRVSFPQELFDWEGFLTFRTVFQSHSDGLQYFGGVFWWTLAFALLASLTCYVVGLFQALIIESKYVVMKRFWRTMFILPWAIPSLVTLLMFRNIFSSIGGLANQVIMSLDSGTDAPNVIVGIKTVLYALGLYREQVPGTFDATYITWFGFLNYRLGRLLILVINLWIGYPYFMLLITGTLTSIPSDMYEAADIDGASAFQKTRYITLPWILRATTPVIITTLTHNFNNFGVIYFLTGSVQNVTYAYDALGNMINVGVPNSAPSIYDILISWVYRLAMLTTVREFNLAAVYSIIIFLMVGTFAIYNLSRVKSFWEED